MNKQKKRIRIFDKELYNNLDIPEEKRIPITDQRVEFRPTKDFFMRRGLLRIDPKLAKEDWFWNCLLSFAVVCRSQLKVDYKHLNGAAHYEMEILSRWLPIVEDSQKTPVYVIEVSPVDEKRLPNIPEVPPIPPEKE